MFHAAQVDGESYWDGSYAGNPMLWPLYEGELDTDILMVQLTRWSSRAALGVRKIAGSGMLGS